MASDPNDPTSDEYWLKRGTSNYQTPQQKEQEAIKAAAPHPGDTPVPTPLGQWGEPDSFFRGAAIAGDQALIGAAAIPMAAIHYPMDLVHSIDPKFPASPAWSHLTGPGSYGEGLTPNALTPSTAWERELAAGARTAGTTATLMPFGLGPVAAGVNIAGSIGGQALREGGYPTAGDVLDVGSGLVSGFGIRPGLPSLERGLPGIAKNAYQAIRNKLGGGAATPAGAGATTAADDVLESFMNNPGPGWQNVPPSGPQAAAAASHDAQMQRLIDIDEAHLRMQKYAPFFSINPMSWAQGLANLRLGAVRTATPRISAATQAAARVLGFGVGGALGGTSAVEAPPAMSYRWAGPAGPASQSPQ